MEGDIPFEISKAALQSCPILLVIAFGLTIHYKQTNFEGRKTLKSFYAFLQRKKYVIGRITDVI